MKKIMIGLLSTLLLLSVSACKMPVQTSSESTAASTKESTQATQETAETVPDAVTQQLPLYAVSVPVLTETDTAEDGTVLFNKIYQNISLVLPDPEVADKIIVDFLNRIDQIEETADEIRSAVQEGYKDAQNWYPYLCQITYDPARIDSGVLSFFGNYTSYSGTSHPDSLCLSATYDLVTGNVLTLADILTENADYDALCEKAISALNMLAEDKSLYEGFEVIVKDLFALNPPINESWYFSDNGLCFCFNPYEIAPYSSGPVVATIPYDELPGILDDAYFPAEKQTAAGKIDAALFSESDLNQFTQISEVIIDQGGSMVLLHTDSLVYNVKLETGFWSADGTTFTPEYTVFAAYTLASGDAVMVETMIPDTLPNLRLCYTSNGETVYRYISQSGKDSSVILLES